MPGNIAVVRYPHYASVRVFLSSPRSAYCRKSPASDQYPDARLCHYRAQSQPGRAILHSRPAVVRDRTHGRLDPPMPRAWYHRHCSQSGASHAPLPPTIDPEAVVAGQELFLPEEFAPSPSTARRMRQMGGSAPGATDSIHNRDSQASRLMYRFFQSPLTPWKRRWLETKRPIPRWTASTVPHPVQKSVGRRPRARQTKPYLLPVRSSGSQGANAPGPDEQVLIHGTSTPHVGSLRNSVSPRPPPVAGGTNRVQPRDAHW